MRATAAANGKDESYDDDRPDSCAVEGLRQYKAAMTARGVASEEGNSTQYTRVTGDASFRTCPIYPNIRPFQVA